ncbi:MAG: hypothetical protein ACKVT1_01940 [Dehalococcoidia bacterium]
MVTGITFLKCKYDGSVKRERTGELLDITDEWIIIAHVPGLHEHLKYGEPEPALFQGTALYYLNRRRPLTAVNWFEERALSERYVDAALPATIENGVARFVDLDLDLIAGVGADAYVKDVLDFERRRVEMAYPPEVVAAAWEGIRIGAELLGQGRFPFDGSAEELYRRAVQ